MALTSFSLSAIFWLSSAELAVNLAFSFISLNSSSANLIFLSVTLFWSSCASVNNLVFWATSSVAAASFLSSSTLACSSSLSTACSLFCKVISFSNLANSEYNSISALTASCAPSVIPKKSVTAALISLSLLKALPNHSITLTTFLPNQSKVLLTASIIGRKADIAWFNLIWLSSLPCIASLTFVAIAERALKAITIAIITAPTGFAISDFKAVPKPLAPIEANFIGPCKAPTLIPNWPKASIALSVYLPILSLKLPTSFFVELSLLLSPSKLSPICLPKSELRCSSLSNL